MLEIFDDDFSSYIDELCRTKHCVCEEAFGEKRIYLYEYFKYENYIAKKLSVLASYRGRAAGINAEPQIDMAEMDSSIKFAHLQREAVRLSLYENVMVNLKPTNKKLKQRMINIVCSILGINEADSEALLDKNNWVIRDAMDDYNNK